MAGIGFAAASTAGVWLSVAVARGAPILEARWGILVRLGMWAAAWAVAVVCALRLPHRVVVPAILAVGVLLRAAALSGPPTLSDDLYRYSWDGRVQREGINPYRYSPQSPALAHLREPWLFPEAARCADIGRPPNCSRINRSTARTIYPPLAQVWFLGVYEVAGIDARHKAWQVAGLLADTALLALLPLVLRAWGRDTRWTALYALSPVPVVEAVNNGHVEGLAALLIVVALLVAARRRPGWAGALIGAAALVKLYPAILVAGLAGVATSRRSALLRAAAGATAVVAVGYLPHVLTVGVRVLGYLPGYLREEDYDKGGRYLLVDVLGLPAGVTAALAAAALAAVVLWVLVRRPSPPRAFAALLGGLLLAATPVQPWYAVTLLALAAVGGSPAWSAVTAAAYPYFFAVILNVDNAIMIGRLSYGTALITVLVASAVGWRSVRRASE